MKHILLSIVLLFSCFIFSLDKKKSIIGAVGIHLRCKNLFEHYLNEDKLHPKLEEDVLIEALLLSHCSFLVHTIQQYQRRYFILIKH